MSETAAAPAPVATPSAPSSPPKSSPSMTVPNASSKLVQTPPSQQVQGSPPQTQQQQKTAPTTPEEFFEVNVLGKTVKMSKQELLSNAGMYAAAHQKFNEASKLKQQGEAFQQKMKQDFITALMDPALGLTKEQIRDRFEKWYLDEFIEPEKLNEDQKARLSAEKELKKYREQEEQRKQQQEQEEMQKLTTQQRDYLQKQIIEAMENSGLPKTKFFASRMAFYMRQNLTNGWEAPIAMIVQQVKNERAAMMTDLADGASVEQLISLLGEGVINKIRQHDLQKLRARRQNQDFGNDNPNPVSTTPGQKLDFNDVNKRLRDMRTGKLNF